MNMKKINFYEYLPQRFAATSEQIVKVRNLIYNFKSGRKEAMNILLCACLLLLMLNIVTALVTSLMLLLAVVSKKTL